MAKLLIYTDLHICTYSSILRGRGSKYSFRLENAIKTIEWINQIAKENQVDDIYNLGDLFDRPDLNAEEITALREMKLDNHKFLVGNHEALSNDLFFNSTNVVKSTIYSKPEIVRYGNTQIVMLPYVTEGDRTSITSVLDNLNIKNEDKIVIFSHNDIKNMYYGNFLTTIGYDVSDIEANCDLFINGHIHNGSWVGKKILNLGSITGINFNNDASSWKPKAVILDTETLELKVIDNPYGVLFYKKEFLNSSSAIEFIQRIAEIKPNPVVVSIKCLEKDRDIIQEELDKYDFIYKRILIDYSKEAGSKELEDTCNIVIDVDYFEKFRQFVKDKYGAEDVNCKLMIEEINKVAAQGGN